MPNDPSKCTRKWHPNQNPSFIVTAPPKCCLFCTNCTDIWWDYTHGPYMMACELHHEENDTAYDCGGYSGECNDFQDIATKKRRNKRERVRSRKREK